MNFKRQMPGYMHKSVAKYMVQMAMCINKPNWLQIVFLNKMPQMLPFLLCIATRIKNDAFLCIVPQDVGVFCEGREFKGVDLGHVEAVDFELTCIEILN